MSWKWMMTPGRNRGKMSSMNTVTSEFMNDRWLPSMKAMSPGSNVSKIDVSATSRPWRITWSQTLSTSARGCGS